MKKLTLEQCRLLVKMTPEEMAKATGFSTTTLYNWESGAYGPTHRQVEKLLVFYKEKGLELSVSDINFLPDQQTA